MEFVGCDIGLTVNAPKMVMRTVMNVTVKLCMSDTGSPQSNMIDFWAKYIAEYHEFSRTTSRGLPWHWDRREWQSKLQYCSSF